MNKEVVCIKIGGSMMDKPGICDEFGCAIAALCSAGYAVVVVHGGGKDIGRQLEMLKKEFVFVEGLRVTDADTLKTVQMVLSGDVNKRIVNGILSAGVKAAGISGVDAGLLVAEKTMVNGNDIGFVGDVTAVDPAVLNALMNASIMPVVSPVSRGIDGQIYNVNADPAASEIACSLKVAHLVFVSDVPGVRIGDAVRAEIRTSEIESFIADGSVTGGMIPKLRGAAEAVSRGVGCVHICGWHGADTLVLEMEPTTASGTVVY
jgi:acetylglutamate kinase